MVDNQLQKLHKSIKSIIDKQIIKLEKTETIDFPMFVDGECEELRWTRGLGREKGRRGKLEIGGGLVIGVRQVGLAD